jgi:hypothetical protein
MVQHPIARIQAIIGELQDATHCDEYERKRVMALWGELGNQIVMLASRNQAHTLEAKANAYDQIAGIIRSTTSPNPGQKETTDADTDATSGRGHRDRGSGDSERPGDQAGPGEAGDSSPETDQGSSGRTSD